MCLSANQASPTPAECSQVTYGSRRRQREGGFTLVELLVVIGIIAVLAALLLPAINLVRASAQTTNCASNMRQFGLAFGIYLQDNDERWATGMWHQLLQEYINESGPIGTLTVPAVYKLCHCPSVPALTSAGVALNASYSYTGHYYASYNSGVPYYFAWQLVSTPPIIADARIVRRTEKCVLSETWDDTNTNAGQASWGKSQLCAGQVAMVHRAGSNFLLADGHMQFVRMTGYTRFIPKSLSDNLWHPYVDVASTLLK
jgi:prepilin-type N-terminal cleavage/methylation domain-containing protein/prepilin-type processing-associated H-X9-DG protein